MILSQIYFCFWYTKFTSTSTQNIYIYIKSWLKSTTTKKNIIFYYHLYFIGYNQLYSKIASKFTYKYRYQLIKFFFVSKIKRVAPVIFWSVNILTILLFRIWWRRREDTRQISINLNKACLKAMKNKQKIRIWYIPVPIFHSF